MMGGSHAATGAAGWVLIAGSYSINVAPMTDQIKFASLPESVTLGFGLVPGTNDFWLIVGAFLCAGFALWPDADHKNSTLGNVFPPWSNMVCSAIAKVAGGHRNGTHSILGIAAFGALVTLIGLLDPLLSNALVQTGAVFNWNWSWFADKSILTGVFVTITIAVALKVLHFVPERARKSPWFIAAALGLLFASVSTEDLWWMPLCALLGSAIHVLGDALTIQKVNLLWPIVFAPPKFLHAIPGLDWVWDKKSGRHGFPVLGNAGSAREWVFVILVVSPVALTGIILALKGTSTIVFKAMQAGVSELLLASLLLT